MSASAMFELHTTVVPAAELRVTEWSCSEALCEPYRLELSATCASGSAEEVAQRLLGQSGVFVFHDASGVGRARRGIVIEARVEGSDGDRAILDGTRLRIVVVPRLALLALKQHSRIFQDLSCEQVLAALFAEWRLEHAFQLSKSHAKRGYCTQYRETDLDFVTRLCAKEGLGLFLEHRPFEDGEADTPRAERLILHDDAASYAPIASSDAAGSTLVHWTEGFAAEEHQVSGFTLARAVRPELVRLGDFDFRRPGLPLSALATLGKNERSPIGEELGGEQLALYLHADRAQLESEGSAPEIDDSIALMRLEQARERAVVGRAGSRCQRLAPGGRFSLEGHPAASLNGDYVVTRVEHRGTTAESGHSESRHEGEVYTNRFECVPAGVLIRAPLTTRQLQQCIETATVVGPKGEEIHCDEHGRVKVQFHWDLEGQSDEKSSCFLRVAQPWAGPNWGAQFIPRIGSEVLVGFVGGDVDRPVVMGSLYNGVRPFPFRFPEEATKTGFRSQSTGGDGFNELVFDDQQGKERFSLRAQRDMEQVVENDYTLTVRSAEVVRVEGDSTRTVSGDSTRTVLGEHIESFAKNVQTSVKGSQALGVDGDAELRISGDHSVRVDGRQRAELFSEATTTYQQDQVVRVLGHQVTVVGQNDARRSSTLHVEGSISQSSTGSTEISSDKEIVLRVGKSALRITPDGIEVIGESAVIHGESLQIETKEQLALFAGKQLALTADNVDAFAGKTLRLKGEQGQLQLDKNARLDGQLVKLNCQPDPVQEDEPPEYEPPKPTIIKLSDEDGNPMPGRRYVVVAPDGSERSGMLDENGEAELFIEESGEVFFPDVDAPRLK